MITRLFSADGERVFDGEIGRFVEAAVIPCHRCGICCERWQPLMSDADIDRLAGHLGMTRGRFIEAYTTSYPFDDEVRLLRRDGNACTFLRRDESGRASCAVHEARPVACRAWTPSLERKECLDGLKRFGSIDVLLPITTVYPDEEDRDAFAGVIRGGGADGGG
ncbi:MAG: YkgJ family cysteine cluster protein [Dehalococcoidia bacterium]